MTIHTTSAVYLSLPQAARELGVCESTIRRWIRDGQLPAIRVGLDRRHRIDLADLDQFREPIRPEDARACR